MLLQLPGAMQKEPIGCMGFRIYRINDKNTETPLPSHAVFPGQQIKLGQTIEEFPVQKFYWKDGRKSERCRAHCNYL